jgi:hypothetical protein
LSSGFKKDRKANLRPRLSPSASLSRPGLHVQFPLPL